MARIRTFIAIDVPAQVRRKAQSTVETLSRTTQSMRWVAPDNVHITLKFLGDVDEKDIYEVCRRTTVAVADFSSVNVGCSGVGAFPSLERPRTVWLGIEDPEAHLEQLHQRVEEGLAPMGFPREQRRFQPHVTLGRLRYGRRDLGDLIPEMERMQVDAGMIPVEELVVYASELGSQGPSYMVLGRAPLAAD